MANTTAMIISSLYILYPQFVYLTGFFNIYPTIYDPNLSLYLYALLFHETTLKTKT